MVEIKIKFHHSPFQPMWTEMNICASKQDLSWVYRANSGGFIALNKLTWYNKNEDR
jgi:hypothetical protein